jgi:hypothetical protein
VTGYEDNLACVEVCNSFPKWGRRDQKRKFVFADNKILLMMTFPDHSAFRRNWY